MKRTLSLLVLSILVTNALAKDITVKVTNLTRGMKIAPLLIVVHPDKHIYENRTGEKLFEEGSSANSEMNNYLGNNTNGGSLTEITSSLNASVQTSNNPKNGYLSEGASISTIINNIKTTNTYLSVIARLQPTNDGFLALNNQLMPTDSGTYTYFVNAYDGGVDANNELAGSTAAYTTGTGGTGIAGVSAEGFIHIHRGNIGDTNSSGGESDYDKKVHRWLNPVAKIELTISN